MARAHKYHSELLRLAFFIDLAPLTCRVNGKPCEGLNTYIQIETELASSSQGFHYLILFQSKLLFEAIQLYQSKQHCVQIYKDSALPTTVLCLNKELPCLKWMLCPAVLSSCCCFHVGSFISCGIWGEGAEMSLLSTLH